MTRVLLTGSRGWFGGLLLPRLKVGGGLDVTCAFRDTPLSEVADLARAADVVLHCGGAYTNRRDELVEGNVEQTVAVAKGTSKAQNTVVFLSSVKLFGWDAEGDGVRHESDPVATVNDNYCTAKRLSEQLLAAAAHRTVVLRVSNAYGRRMPGKYIIGGMLDTFRREGKVTLACTGASRRDFVDIDDVIRVMESITRRALTDPGPPGARAYTVASGRLLTLMQVGEVFRDVLGARIETKGGPVQSSPRFANGRVIEDGHIDAFRDPSEGLRDVLGAYKAAPWPAGATPG